jgi:hypothetical protein
MPEGLLVLTNLQALHVESILSTKLTSVASDKQNIGITSRNISVNQPDNLKCKHLLLAC